jgi:hypothetical protein
LLSCSTRHGQAGPDAIQSLKRRELIALLGSAAAASPRILRARDGRRPSRQEQWTADFNAGNPNICGLFALELRYDYRGYPERNFKDICRLLRHSLQDPTKKFTYALNIKEILVSDELAVVRLI